MRPDGGRLALSGPHRRSLPPRPSLRPGRSAARTRAPAIASELASDRRSIDALPASPGFPTLAFPDPRAGAVVSTSKGVGIAVDLTGSALPARRLGGSSQPRIL